MKMNKSKQILFGMTLAMVLNSCHTPYHLSGIERSRILVDSRYDAQPDARATAFMAPYKQQVDSVMSPVVGTIDHYMAADKPESDLSNLLSDILVWGGKAYGEQPQLAIYNMGGMRAAFAAGAVTYGDVLDVAPFENKICFLTLTGEKLLELFRQIANRQGEGVSHGVELVITPSGQLLSARLHGKSIVPEAQYRIATLDYLAQGNDGLLAFKSATNLVSPQEEANNVRFIIMNYFREQAKAGRTVNARKEGRIVIK